MEAFCVPGFRLPCASLLARARPLCGKITEAGVAEPVAKAAIRNLTQPGNQTRSEILYDIPLRRLNGQPATLREFEGDAMLIVNVASKCGLTPQYAGLETLYEHFREQGLQVLGFPCNDFAGQEPGSAQEIEHFCTANYGVRFPMFEKVTINGAPRHPLYARLIEAQPNARAATDGKLRDALAQHGLLPRHPGDVMWNFEKFLVGRDGRVVARFAPDVAPDDPVLVDAIEGALS